MLKSVKFGRFMTSEGTETLNLAFTSKMDTGYSYLDFPSENGYI